MERGGSISISKEKSKKIEAKILLMDQLFDLAYECKKYQIRKKNPNLSEIEINHKAYELIERGCR